jgi:glycosyltransferase involved in cell wall biosynthesis
LRFSEWIAAQDIRQFERDWLTVSKAKQLMELPDSRSRKRLLCLLEHPTQYDPPLWLALARRGLLAPEVWYASGLAPADSEANSNVDWGLEGRPHTLVPDADLLHRLNSIPERPDAILTPGWRSGRTWRAVAFAKVNRIPMILPSDKTQDEPSSRRLPQPFLSLAHSIKSRMFDGFFTTGSLGVNHLRSLGVPECRIATGLYPIDVEDWSRNRLASADASREFRSRVGGTFVILAVTKMSERENPLLVIDGFAKLRARIPGARLVFVGDGELRRAVHRRVDDLGMSSDVRFPGYVKYTDLPMYYGAADVFVHVPRREPWGISVSEAMACGLPVIASPETGAAVDLVVSNLSGHVLSRDDPEELANRLIDIACHPDRSMLSQGALRQVSIVGTVAAAQNLENLVAILGERARWDSLVSVAVGAMRKLSG